MLHLQNSERSHYFFSAAKQGFTRVSLLFFFLETKSLKMSFFFFFLRDQVPQNVLFFLFFKKQFLSFFPVQDKVSNNIPFPSFSLSLSAVFPLDRENNGV